MDVLHKALKALDHNRYAALAAVLAISAAVWLGACASTTAGIDGSSTVTRAELSLQVIQAEQSLAARSTAIAAAADALNLDIEAHNRRVALAAADLDRQDAIRAQIVELTGGAIVQLATGGISPAGLAATAVGLLGVLGASGLALDNRRKDRVIAAKP